MSLQENQDEYAGEGEQHVVVDLHNITPESLIAIFGNRIPPNDRFFMTGYGKAINVPNYGTLMKVLNNCKTTYGMVYFEKLKDGSEPKDGFSMDQFAGDPIAQISFLEGGFSFPEVEATEDRLASPTCCFIITGGKYPIKFIKARGKHCESRSANYPYEVIMGEFYESPLDYGFSYFKMDPYTVVNCEHHDLFRLCTNGTVPWQTKVLSVMYGFYPHISAVIRAKCTVVNWDNAMRRWGDNMNELEPEQQSQLSSLLVVLLTEAVLIHSYSRTDRYTTQLKGRISAALSGGMGNEVSEDLIKRAITSVGLKVGEDCAFIDEILGHLIAVDQDDDYNPDVEKINLMPLERLCEMHDMHEYAKKVLIQARLVYEKYKGRSVRFGRDAIEYAERFFGQFGDAWGNEVIELKKIANELDSRPYIGLRATIPEKYHVRNYPRLILFGIEIHRRTLTSEDARKEFEKYNVSSIISHLPDPNDVELIKSMVSIVPTANIRVWATIIKSLNYHEACSYVSIRTDAEKETIFAYMVTAKKSNKPGWEHPGPWYDKKVQEKTETYLLNERTKCVNALKDKLQKLYGRQRTELDFIADIDERRSKAQELESKRRNIEDLLDQQISIDMMVTPAVDPSIDEVRSLLIADMKAVLSKIETAFL